MNGSWVCHINMLLFQRRRRAGIKRYIIITWHFLILTKTVYNKPGSTHEIYRMWHKPFILVVATILTVWSSALASSWHKASVKPPWAWTLAPRLHRLDGHGEHSKLLGFQIFESQHFCKIYEYWKYIADFFDKGDYGVITMWYQIWKESGNLPNETNLIVSLGLRCSLVKAAGHSLQHVCQPWRRLHLHALQTDRVSSVPHRSLEWAHPQLYQGAAGCISQAPWLSKLFLRFLLRRCCFVFLTDRLPCVRLFPMLFFHSFLNLNLDTWVVRCIWDCFESHVLDFADSQWLEYQEQKDMNATWSSTVKLGGQILSSMFLWWENSHHGQLSKDVVIVCHFQF